MDEYIRRVRELDPSEYEFAASVAPKLGQR